MDIHVRQDRNLSTIVPAMVDVIAMRAGTAIANPHPRSAEFAHYPLAELARICLQIQGMDASKLSKIEVARFAIQASSGGGSHGHTGSDFPSILENAMNKSLLQGFREAPHSWQFGMRKRIAPNFKPISAVRLGEAPSLNSIGENCEYQEVTIGDEREVYSLAKYGYLFSISWESIVNDDLEAFGRLPLRLGDAAARTANNLAYAPIIGFINGEVMSDGTALFHANHSNLAGSGGAPDITTLGAARAAMRTQTGVNSSVSINVEPRFLIVPAALETVAEQLIGSTVDPTKSNATPNPFQNRLQIISEPLLDAVSPGSSTTAWYLAGNHNQIDTMEVAFLAGEEEPQLMQVDGFMTDGRRYKVRHCVAAKAIDWRGVYKNAGV